MSDIVDTTDDSYHLPLTNHHKIIYDTMKKNGLRARRSIVFGRSNARRLFDPNKLEEAFERVRTEYGDQIQAMSIPTLKVLTWEHYREEDPFTYKKIKSKDLLRDKVIEDKDTEEKLTKENITIVDPTVPHGTTALLLGGSLCGKTTLLVQALNNILKKHKDRYDVIIIMSQTTTSIPLRDLNKSDKIIIFNKFIPELIGFLIKVQMATSNPLDGADPTMGFEPRYSILIVLDDITKLKNPAIDELILVARNYGISTIISTQKINGLSPSARESIHSNFIFGGRNPETRRKLIEKYLRGYIVERGFKKPDDMDLWLRENTIFRAGERDLIKINGLNDKMSIHTIRK